MVVGSFGHGLLINACRLLNGGWSSANFRGGAQWLVSRDGKTAPLCVWTGLGNLAGLTRQVWVVGGWNIESTCLGDQLQSPHSPFSLSFKLAGSNLFVCVWKTKWGANKL